MKDSNNNDIPDSVEAFFTYLIVAIALYFVFFGLKENTMDMVTIRFLMGYVAVLSGARDTKKFFKNK